MMTLKGSRRLLFRSVMAGLTALCVTGCSNQRGGGESGLSLQGLVGGSTRQMNDVQPVAGFLPQPALLQPGGTGRAALAYVAPGANFSSYNKVWLDPVTIWAAADSHLRDVPLEQRQAIADMFYADLYNALKKVCTMVNARSPGTMHVRFAISDAKTPNASINTIATYAPYASSAYTVASLAFNKGVGYFAGTATVEGFAIDAMTGALLWEGVDKRGGTTTLVANTLDNWRDVRHAFEDWSTRLASRLQELGACRGRA